MNYVSRLFQGITVLGLSTLLSIQSTAALETDHDEYQTVSSFINLVTEGDKEKIASFFRYPLKRSYPIPDIQNKQEFIDRFDQIFDQELMTAIASSNIKTDWRQVGWRGVMLGSGLVWVNGGQITAVNYQTDLEDSIEQQIIRQQQANLHASVQQFQRPILDWTTEQFHIRVDQLKDDSYRYSAWSLGTSTDQQPDLILYDGNLTITGSGGNHHYEFRQGDYLYKLLVFMIGSKETPPGQLEVFRNEHRILLEVVLSPERQKLR